VLKISTYLDARTNVSVINGMHEGINTLFFLFEPRRRTASIYIKKGEKDQNGKE
jgi:hypothetical protein